MKILSKKIIMGCDSRGDGESPYLTRWTIIGTKLGALYLHYFHRSDADEHHDHPWGFISIILWRGYLEETPCVCRGESWFPAKSRFYVACPGCEGSGSQRRRVWPGMILFRRATHRHRVELVNGKPAVTLIIRGPEVRDWGFFTKNGWQVWRDYFKELGCK